MPLKNGEVFAGYVIQRFIGAGAMGEVYLVQHPRLPRMDALKVLPSALTANAEYRFRFNREADLASTLWHSNIVGVHDRGEFNGQLWISMDYVDGTDAQHLIEESYPTGMPMHEVLEIVTAVADALDVAHQRGLLHRDVKPSNILLAKAQGPRRRILLADFGIARQTDEVSGLTGTNMTVGSVGYAAPEQLMGEPLDGRADQYGLAATAFHLFTGARPFRDSNPAVVISKQLTTPAPMLSERRADLANLDRVLSVALGKDPNERYPHCLDFAEALSRASRQGYTRGTVAPADATRAVSVPSPSDPPRPLAHPTRSVEVPPPVATTPEPPETADVHEEQPSTPPGAPAEKPGNLLADPHWADALSAFFAERWADAVERFETLQASYPGEGRVETRLKEARRQRDIDAWSSKAKASAAKADWDTVVTALENLIALDPSNRDVGARLEQARMAQRRKALVDEMTALHQAGRWDAVVAAARELARIDPDNSDPGGIVSDARAKIREAELPDRYAQALNHLDQEQWQQAADLLATVEQEHPGYRDAAALLKTAQQKLRGTAEVRQRPAPPPGPLPQTTTPAPPSTPTPPVPVAVQSRWQTSSWRVAAMVLIGVILVGGLTIWAVGKSSKSSNTSTSTSTAMASPSMSDQAPGPNATIAEYIKKNHIRKKTITYGTPGAPTIDLPVPQGWTRIPSDADAHYGGLVFNTPSDPNDPPNIIATVEKLTGNVDTDKLLAVAPGEVKNLPGYDGDGAQDKLSGYPAYQLGGSYTKNGVTRVIAQNTVVIQNTDGIYLLQLHAEGPQADADALKSATVVVGQQTTITP
jgi:serine/threonine protein kinase